MIDSGAVITLLNKDDCDLLGYQLTSGTPYKIKGIGGNEIQTYVHSIDMKVGDEPIKVRVAFSDSPKHALVLGRLDVFDKFEIDLRGKTLDSYLARDL